ncbi:MAG: aspartate kinase [Bacteroidota bacterium]|nr:aspartate kinase [Bacteroidota bacterium]
MKVFKFGGASTNSFDRIQNLAHILENHKDEKILIVISAMGKMTNALEKVVDAFYEERKEDALQLFYQVKNYHLDQLKYLVTLQWQKATDQLNDFFTEVEWLLHDKPVKDYNYYYDQVVCTGELLSSTLISFFLNEKKIKNQWIDVRDLLRTDDTFRDGKVDWIVSKKQVDERLAPLFQQNNFVVTQGFIGSTDENESTTLGREGSDFTAAIFAELLNAESVTIWKDVNGVMNADPKEFTEAVTIEELSYKEVIEMAYYGAQVIHPKTIKPLQNKNIPLYVRSFSDLRLTGTVITQKSTSQLPPMIVYKRRQVLITLETTDFSFVEGKPTAFLHKILEQVNVKPNLTQNTAISLMICIDDIPEKTGKIALAASEIFEVQIQKDLQLLTIRHYTTGIIDQLSKNKEVILEQKTKETIQLLMINEK